MRVYLSIATLCGFSLFGNVPSASAASGSLVAAARSAGILVSTQVFEETAEPARTGSEKERERPAVSGKVVLLGAAMVSAAIVGAAFILRDRCKPAAGLWLEVPRYRPPSGREGVPPAPLPPLPNLPLPDVCVPG